MRYKIILLFTLFLIAGTATAGIEPESGEEEIVLPTIKIEKVTSQAGSNVSFLVQETVEHKTVGAEQTGVAEPAGEKPATAQNAQNVD